MARTSVGSVCGTRNGPISAIRMMALSARKPMNPARLRRIALKKSCTDATACCDALGRVSSIAVSIVCATSLLLACDPDARVQPAVEQVGKQVGHDNGRGDDHEDALHDGVVTLENRLQEHVSDALVLEDRLDQDRAADHKPGGDREL